MDDFKSWGPIGIGFQQNSQHDMLRRMEEMDAATKLLNRLVADNVLDPKFVEALSPDGKRMVLKVYKAGRDAEVADRICNLPERSDRFAALDI